MSVQGILGWLSVAVVLAIVLYFVFFNLLKDDDGTKDPRNGMTGVFFTVPFVGIMFLLSALFNKSVITNELVPLNTSNNSSGEMFISFEISVGGLGKIEEVSIINYIEKTNDDTLDFTIENIVTERAKISYINEGETPYIEKTCKKPLGLTFETCYSLVEATFYVPEGSVSNEK